MSMDPLEDYYPIRDIIREMAGAKVVLMRYSPDWMKIMRNLVKATVQASILQNSMPKPAEFYKAARSIVAHFPIAKDSASTADKVVYSSWYDSNSNVGRLLNYVRDRRSDNKNKGAVVRSYTKRKIEDSAETLVDIGLAEKERFMRENHVTAENKEKMLQFHRDTLDIRRKWIAAKKPTLTDIVKRFPRFTTLKAADPLFDLNTANDRSLEVFLSLPVLFPPCPSRASKGTTLPNPDMISQKLVRRFPEGTNLAEALRQAETDGMIQPGLIVIGDRRYLKADLVPIKIPSSSAADSIAILFAMYHVFNLSFPEHLNLVYNFLQHLVDFEQEASEPSKKKKVL
ncbi:hypothetical protein OUZ56_010048 [Daphnia magna]|uniref:Uncharacterized protein n=1 Tax=Daphnia magna TaxID=35525 RepID=A0ABR0AHV2_9CRUS|nr:hypothetical protein OUZ56_010048 [Daphnia magna]